MCWASNIPDQALSAYSVKRHYNKKRRSRSWRWGSRYNRHRPRCCFLRWAGPIPAAASLTAGGSEETHKPAGKLRASLDQRDARTRDRLRASLGRKDALTRGSLAGAAPPPHPAPAAPHPRLTHLLGLLGEGVGRSHHHVGTGVRVLRQVDAGHPLPRREERALAARAPERPARHRRSPAGLAASRPGAYPVLGLEVPHALGAQRPSAPVHQHPACRHAAAPALLSPARMGRPAGRASGGRGRCEAALPARAVRRGGKRGGSPNARPPQGPCY